MFADDEGVRVPAVDAGLSTRRLLSMGWLDGERLMTFKEAPLEQRNLIAQTMFRAWWYPFSRFGAIHGDPHLGNYTIRTGRDGAPLGINLLDYGCIRTFTPRFMQGVVDLRAGLLHDDRARVVNAYETWGFQGLTNELIDTMNIWARFIYGPLLDDRVRTIADGVAPGDYGRKEAITVRNLLKEKGPVTVPREFVFMDRAAIGLGGVFLHLRAELNWFRMFEETLAGFDFTQTGLRQRQAFEAAGVPVPV
jgi:predicted unusual protein kinase regulating ubiquinone biosynthesis (AarF/ABC1/UbiB family)